MTIRFTCNECSSVLKIKDELAGTKGRCPKCKTDFVVPEPLPVEAAKSPNGTVSINSAPTKSEVTPPKSLAPDDHHDAAEDKQHTQDKEHSAETNRSKAAPLAIPDDDAPSGSHNGDGHKNDHEQPAPLALSDDELDSPALPSGLPLVTAEKRTDSSNDLAAASQENDAAGHDESMRHSLGFDDDDELDSPPVLAGEPIVAPQSDFKAGSELGSSKTDKKNRPVPESFRTNEKPSPAKQKAGKGKGEDEMFDAFAFLMNDQNREGGNVASGDSDLILTDDSDYDLLGRPTPVKAKSPAPKAPAPKATAAPAPRPAPEKVDLATAAKMMKKAIKDAQTDATRQHQLDAKPGYDYTLFFREFGLRGLLILGALVVGVFLSVMAGRYLVMTSLKTPPLVRLSGTVTLDGQPVANAMIYFAPYEMEVPGSRRDRSRTSIGKSDDKGAFKMMYSPDDHIEGVRVGKNRVWVVHFGQKGSDVPHAWSEGGVREQMIEKGKSYIPFDINMTTEAKAK